MFFAFYLRLNKKNAKKKRKGVIMVTDALFITFVGMVCVFAFLFLLMWVIRLMSICLCKLTSEEKKMDKVAAVIGIALQRGEK